jgi:hypothetical protein
MCVSTKGLKTNKKQEHMCGIRWKCVEGTDYFAFGLLVYSCYFF